MRVYATIAIPSYVAMEVWAWWLFFFPALLGAGVAVVGRLMAGYFANDEVIAIMLAIVAVAVATIFVVFTFYQVASVLSNHIDLLIFGVVVGTVVSLVAAITAPVLTSICRRGVPKRVG